ncbi:MAG: glycyl-radical enzyme activating protein [Clostridia bacterium]|nr:glycyl-radical enzyme activating protein [Clostridia bacterium]
MKTLVSDIQRFSIHDGPGIRTTVFLKGCPLKCAWCHNPECISFEQETLFYAEKCIGCGKCAEGCYSGARVLCGKEMTPEDVLSEILADRAFYGDEGGVTVSGGEPLAHAPFVKKLVALCRAEGIKTAVETSLYRFDEELLSSFDLIMTDVKIWDEAAHEKYVGFSAEAVRQNLRLADALGVPIIVRTPIIPTVNDTVENVKETAAFLRTLKNVVKYELLPYHPLGLSKAKALGRDMTEFSVPTKEKMKELSAYAEL